MTTVASQDDYPAFPSQAAELHMEMKAASKKLSRQIAYRSPSRTPDHYPAGWEIGFNKIPQGGLVPNRKLLR